MLTAAADRYGLVQHSQRYDSYRRCWPVWFGIALSVLWFLPPLLTGMVWYSTLRVMILTAAADRYGLVQHSPCYDSYRRCWPVWFGAALSVLWFLPPLLTGMVWYSTLHVMILTAAAGRYGLVQHSPCYDAYRRCLLTSMVWYSTLRGMMLTNSAWNGLRWDRQGQPAQYLKSFIIFYKAWGVCLKFFSFYCRMSLFFVENSPYLASVKTLQFTW